MIKIKKFLLATFIGLTICSQGNFAYNNINEVLAATSTTTSNSTNSLDEDKNQCLNELSLYYSNLKSMNQIDEVSKNSMDAMYNKGVNYIKNATTSTGLYEYVKTIESNLDTILKRTTYDEVLVLSNVAGVNTAKYGQDTMVVLSLMNLGSVNITNLVIYPEDISNDVKKWPFEITQSYDAKYISVIQGSRSYEDAFEKRMDIGWNFKVSKDALTGCYPLKFNVTYSNTNGEQKTTSLTTYINIEGKDPKKKLIETEESKTKDNPRIIVTGFSTTPEEVYAGTVFELSVSVKNTSKTTTVKNVLFNLEATVEGGTNEASYAAFLPTSGSNAVYTDEIKPGETYDMKIEMEVKSDLSQKPYVLTVSMKYDTDDATDVTDSAHVSVPIKQEAKLDVSNFDISPNCINVGEEADVMFSIYNTGKTTLYNVKVMFESEEDAVEDKGIIYVGNITPGNTGNVDTTLTGIASNVDNPKMKVVVTYEDETGVESKFEKDTEFTVDEMIMEDFGSDDMGDVPMPEVPSGPSALTIVFIIVGVLAVVIIVIVIIVKKKKAKRNKEDLDLLD